MNTTLMKSLDDYLYSTKIYEKALEFYQQLLLENKKQSSDETKIVALSYANIGLCLFNLKTT